MALITVTWSVPLHVRMAIARQHGRLDMPAGEVEMGEWIRSVVNEAMLRVVEAPPPKPAKRRLIPKRRKRG